MIYLIGGAPRCGKTTLAKKFSKRLKIAWVSVDTLESVVRQYVDPFDEKLFPKNALRRATGNSNDKMYAEVSPQKIAQSYIGQAKTSYKAITAFVDDCINEGHDFVLEGYQIHPKLANTLIKKYPGEIKALFLAKQDIQALVKGFTKSSAKNDWVLQKTKNKETFHKIAQMLYVYGKYILDESQKYNLPIHFMDKDFSNKIDQIVKQIV